MKTAGFRSLLDGPDPLVLPCAHDALSARLIEQAGFSAMAIGGFAIAAARYGLPDVGVTSFGELAAGVRDIRAQTSLPMLVDADDGYGDVKNVTRTVRVYEDMGIAGLVLEDQTSPKRCGHTAGKNVVPRAVAETKLKAALDARRDPDLFIVARTDARGVLGLDEALERGARFLSIGADALFVEAPQSVDELERIGRSFGDAVLVANVAENSRTPVLPAAQLGRLGFSMLIYPGALLWRIVSTMRRTLDDLRHGRLATPDDLLPFHEMTSILGMPEWVAVDDRYADVPTGAVDARAAAAGSKGSP